MTGIGRSIWESCGRNAGTHTASLPSISVTFEKILKFCKLFKESDSHNTCGTIALLGNDKLGPAGILFVRLVDFFAEDEGNQVGVLLNRSGLAQIRQLRAVVPLPLFRSTA